jgi:hypothetical protein
MALSPWYLPRCGSGCDQQATSRCTLVEVPYGHLMVAGFGPNHYFGRERSLFGHGECYWFVVACRSLFSRGADLTVYSIFSTTVHTKLQSTRSYIIAIGQDEKKERMIDDERSLFGHGEFLVCCCLPIAYSLEAPISLFCSFFLYHRTHSTLLYSTTLHYTTINNLEYRLKREQAEEEKRAKEEEERTARALMWPIAVELAPSETAPVTSQRTSWARALMIVGSVSIVKQ